MESTTKPPELSLKRPCFGGSLSMCDLRDSRLFGVVLGAAGALTLLVPFPQEVYRIPKKSQAEKESSGKSSPFPMFPSSPVEMLRFPRWECQGMFCLRSSWETGRIT